MSSQKTQVPLPELVHLSLKPLIFWFRIVVTAEIVIGDGHAGRGHFRLFSGVWSFSRAYGGALSFCCSHWEAAHFDVSAGGHLKAADSSGRWDGFRADPGRGLRFMNSVFRARERWWWWWGRGWRWWCWRWSVGGRWDYDCWILSSVWVLITGHRNLKWRMSMYMNLLYKFFRHTFWGLVHTEKYIKLPEIAHVWKLFRLVMLLVLSPQRWSVHLVELQIQRSVKENACINMNECKIQCTILKGQWQIRPSTLRKRN